MLPEALSPCPSPNCLRLRFRAEKMGTPVAAPLRYLRKAWADMEPRQWEGSVRAEHRRERAGTCRTPTDPCPRPSWFTSFTLASGLVNRRVPFGRWPHPGRRCPLAPSKCPQRLSGELR